MNEILLFLEKNPAYLAVAAVLVLFASFSLAKKLIKTALLAAVLFAAYCYYLHSEGKALPTQADAERVLEEGRAMKDKLEKQAGQAKAQVDEARSKLDALRGRDGGR